MANRNILKFVKEVQDLINGIWQKPPSEIEKMRQFSKVDIMRPFFKVNYAFHALHNLAGTLRALRTCAKNGVSIDGLKSVTISILEEKIVMIEVVGLVETPQLLKRACKVLLQVQNSHEYTDIVSKLITYLGKMSDRGWLDLEMHWSELSSAYDIIDSLIEHAR